MKSWTRQKYNSFMDYPAVAMHLRRGVTPQLAGLIQDALRRRDELRLTLGGKSIANLPLFCRAKSLNFQTNWWRGLAMSSI